MEEKVQRKGKSSEIRGTGFKVKVLGKALGFFMRFYTSTFRYKVCFAVEGNPFDEPVIVAYWHNGLIAMPEMRLRLPQIKKLGVLISASKDGAYAEHATSFYKMRAIRGSSSRRGVAALVGMMKSAQQGFSIAIPPDGPKGPVYKVKKGILHLCGTMGLPIVPVCVEISSAWRLKTWDKLKIPKPFSTITIHIASPIHVPRELTEEQSAVYSKYLEDALSPETYNFSSQEYIKL